MKTEIRFDVDNPNEFLSKENYDSLGIATIFEGNRLTGLQMLVEHNEESGHADIVRQARDKIVPLRALIRFYGGPALQLGAVYTQAIEPLSSARIGLGFVKLEAALVKPIPLPPPATIASLSGEVTRQLGWFNAAEDSSWVIEKIRDYYEVLELEDQLTGASYKPKDEMKHLRDAVSHPRLDRNPKAVKYLQDNLGTDHIDPNNDTHLQFLEGKVELLRTAARIVLEAKLPAR